MSLFVITDNHGSLNLRHDPSASSAVLAKIPYGTELAAIKVNDTWSEVTYEGQTGYVMTKFLSEQKPIINKADIKKAYNSLKECLEALENILK